MSDELFAHKEYAFLLGGLAAGFLLGWWVGRGGLQRSNAIGLENDPAAIQSPPQAGVSLVVNGKTVEVDPSVMVEIQGLILQGNKTGAIDRLREVSGLNLAGTRSVIESLEKVIR